MSDSPTLLPLDRMRRYCGFGYAKCADGYGYQPGTVEEAAAVFEVARAAGRKVVFRGAARSYGDPAIAAEQVVLDTGRLNRILSFDSETGLIEAEPGVTLADIWRHTLPHGWWPPVVSGTMKTSLGGAIAMNIHGKNNFMRGPFGEHVVRLDLLTTDGAVRTCTPGDGLFEAVVSGAGLLGLVVRATVQLKKVASGNLRVQAVSCRSWDEQFEAFERFEAKEEYVVSWIDCFGSGSESGRGLLHAASHEQESDVPSLQIANQDLPPRIMGLFPKSQVWRALKVLNNRRMMRLVNVAKHFAGKREHGKTYLQSLAKYSFLLDYVPGWEQAYLPGGLIQWQCFVPRAEARQVFEELVQMQQDAGMESFLAVMKRHRPDGFLLSHAVDGYSLALDFKFTAANREMLHSMLYRMTEKVLEAGGRFYFAKDSTLTADQAHRFLGDSVDRFKAIKAQLDPEGLITSDLSRRLGLY